MPLSVLSIEENLTRYFENKFSERRENRISEITSLAKGWETELFSFKYKYIEEGDSIKKQLILRIYPARNVEKKTKWEFEVLTSLFKVGYPVPETHVLELDLEYFEYPFIIMDRISGKDMGDDFTKALQEGNLGKITNEILPIQTKLFVELHNLDWKILPIDFESDIEITPGYLLDRLIINSEKRVEKFQLQDLNPIFQWLKEKKHTLKFEKISILHNDFHPHNIIISEEDKAYVIDWPACFVGDFRQDLGWTLLLTGAYTSKEIRDMVLKFYEEKLRSEVQDIEYFEILAATRRIMDMFIFLEQDSEIAGIRDETRQQIKETAFHLEYVAKLVKDITGISIPRFKELIQSLLIE